MAEKSVVAVIFGLFSTGLKGGPKSILLGLFKESEECVMSKIVHQESILVLGCERVAELPVWVEELPNGVRQITGLTSKTFSVFRHFNVNPALGDLFELVEALAKESSNVRCFVETDE